MNVVDFGKLKPGRQDPQTGFYIVAQCPECNAPIFWHGPGEGQEEMVYPSCICFYEGQFEMAIPEKYEFEIERHSLNILFRNLYQALMNFESLIENTKANGESHEEDRLESDNLSDEGRD